AAGSGAPSAMREMFTFSAAPKVAGSTRRIGGGGSPKVEGRSRVRNPHQYDGSGFTGMPGYSSRIVSENGPPSECTPGASPKMASAQAGDSASFAPRAGTP